MRRLKPIGTFILAIVILLAPLTHAYMAPEPPNAEALLQHPEALITRGAFVMLVNNAIGFKEDYDGIQFLDVPDNHPYAADLLRAKVAGFIVGDGRGRFFPDAIISGAEVAVIVYRFLEFDDSKVEKTSVAVPAWAVPAASTLLDLTMVDKGLIEKKQLTVGDAMVFLHAFDVAMTVNSGPYAVTQARQQDDYYAYINKRYFVTAITPPGYMSTMSFVDTMVMVEKQQQEILSGILAGTNWAKGSDEWKIKELYKMHMDNNARTASLAKVQPYLDEIRAIKTIDQLLGLVKKYSKYFNIQPFYMLTPTMNAKDDATKWCSIVLPTPLDLESKEYYADDESMAEIQEAYKEYLALLLGYMGEKDDINARVEALYAIEKQRADKTLPQEAYSDPYFMYADTTWQKMLDMTSTTQSLKQDEGKYEIIKNYPIYCPEPDYIKYIESLYIEKNLRALKDVAMLNVLTSFGMVLGDDYEVLDDGLNAAKYGGSGEKSSAEQNAQAFVTTMMSQVFSRLYAEKYSSEKIKKDVTGMIEDVRSKFRERIMALDWMSEKTKLAAVDKLEAIKVFVAYPDEPIEAVLFNVKAKDEGGSLIDLLLSVSDVNYNESLKELKKTIEINPWDIYPTSTVNAFYMPTENSIVVPAGILQGVFYNPNAPREKNLGAIVAIIAHEFTHAFDSSGAKYDKHGTLKDWWTKEDYAAFNKLTTNMEEALSEIAFIDDIYVNGALCKAESIADLGAIACVLDIVDDKPNADYSMLMEAWAATWAARLPYEFAVYLLYTDEHAPNKIRVNFILSQFDEFYKVYNIKETDGMYVPKEERLSIW